MQVQSYDISTPFHGRIIFWFCVHADTFSRKTFFLIPFDNICLSIISMFWSEILAFDLGMDEGTWGTVFWLMLFFLTLISFLMLFFWWTVGMVPLAAFGWVMATHLSLYPMILIIPVCPYFHWLIMFDVINKKFVQFFNEIMFLIKKIKKLKEFSCNIWNLFCVFSFSLMHIDKYLILFQIILLLGYGPDTPRKLLLMRRCGKVEDNSSSDSCQQQEKVINQSDLPKVFAWGPPMLFLLWAIMWSVYVLLLCGISVKQYGGLWEMFERYQQLIVRVCISLCSNILDVCAKEDI